jgi:hypothetical protein
MSWLSKYTFQASHPTQGARTLTPTNEDIIFEGAESDDVQFIRPTLEELSFTGEDYDYFFAIDQGDRCDKITLTVSVDYEGVTYDIFSGYFSINSADWNPRNCTVTIGIEIEDDRSCILDNWEEETNILSGTTKQTARALIGELEFGISDPSNVSGIFPDSLPANQVKNGVVFFTAADGWGEYATEATGLTPQGPGGTPPYTGQLSTSWVREVVTSITQPPGAGWQSLGGNQWARIPIMRFNPIVYRDVTNPVTGVREIFTSNLVVGALVEVASVGNTGGEEGYPTEYDNGILLDDVIAELLDEMGCDLAVKSNFFRINNDEVLPSTDPYIAAEAGFDKIMLWQKTDVKLPDATGNATRALLNLEDLINNLKAVFNIDWDVEDDGATLRIEHISYFDRANGQDWTQSPYSDHIAGRTAYSYNSDEIPKKETFAWMDPADEDFEGLPIRYSDACSGENVEAFNADKLYSDLGYLQVFPDQITDKGFFIGAMLEFNGLYYFAIESSKYNGHLAFERLHPNYWTYQRPYITGVMNGIDTTFDTARKIKVQEALAISVDPATYSAINFADLQKSQYEWGEVSEFSYSVKNCLLTVTLRHDS